MIYVVHDSSPLSRQCAGYSPIPQVTVRRHGIDPFGKNPFPSAPCLRKKRQTYS